MEYFKRKRPLNLALQGGGAHGAYTWGVLDRLLEDERVDPGWVSGTSAGAVNAVALASGLTTGGRAGARETLANVWLEIARAGVPDFVRLNPFFSTLSRSPAVAQMASLFSPTELNPLGFDPFRALLEASIDFKAIRERSAIELIVSATDVRSGQARHFATREITVETVLASACLPALHRAIEIDGNSYWDGGFSSNPDLVGLARHSPHRDTLIVQLQPLKRADVPTGAHAISDHVYHLVFLAPLVRDVELITTCRDACGGPRQYFPRAQGPGRLADHRFHLIDATPHTSKLDWSSKVNPEIEVFKLLFEAGREDTAVWLSRHREDLGRRETVDLRGYYLGAEKAPTVDVPPPPRNGNGSRKGKTDAAPPSEQASGRAEQRGQDVPPAGARKRG